MLAKFQRFVLGAFGRSDPIQASSRIIPNFCNPFSLFISFNGISHLFLSPILPGCGLQPTGISDTKWSGRSSSETEYYTVASPLQINRIPDRRVYPTVLESTDFIFQTFSIFEFEITHYTFYAKHPRKPDTATQQFFLIYTRLTAITTRHGVAVSKPKYYIKLCMIDDGSWIGLYFFPSNTDDIHRTLVSIY